MRPPHLRWPAVHPRPIPLPRMPPGLHERDLTLYVEDMDLDELREWEAALADESGEQAEFDLEDVRERIQELES
ncbi:hypothetical protein SEA_EAGLEPRIDE_74 [Mycobacterium phage Eaglepride]|nr:hypothetical protein SEA_EAGLEPRIDE_74 [Mycobacterium phage Eaglepride]